MVGKGRKITGRRTKNMLKSGYMDIYEKIKPLSYRQKQVIEFWLSNGRKSKAKALRKVGYSEAICNQPHKVFSSPAVKRELELRGLGIDGMSNGLKPKGFDISIKEPEPKFDIVSYFANLPKDQLQVFLEVLDNTEPSPMALERRKRQKETQNKNSSGYSIPKNDPNCNLFGERLPNRPEPVEEIKMSDFSSI